MILEDTRYGLFVSIVEHESDTFFTLFESNNINVNEPLNKYEWTALQTAAYTGNIQIVHYLLHRGADVTIINKRGLSAYDMAQENGHFEIAELLSDTSSVASSIEESTGWIQLNYAPEEGHEQEEEEQFDPEE